MRVLNVHPGGNVVLRSAIFEDLANGLGRRKPGTPEPIYMQFQPWVENRVRETEDLEEQVAYERFGSQIRRGSRMDESGTQPASQTWRIGVFDTEWLPEHQREEAERLIRSHKRLGIDFLIFEAPSLNPPVPNWDSVRGRGQQTTPERLVALVEELGLDVNYCLKYERSKKNRSDVIEALEALIGPRVEVIEVSA